MARKRKRKTSRMPAGLRRYWNNKNRGKRRKRKATPVAKRRRRRTSSRRAPARRRRRGGGGGGGGSLFPMLGLPSKEKAMDIAAAGVIGYLEVKAAGDADHILNKIPRPITQIGYSGGTALALYLLAKFGPGSIAKYARHLANGSASVAMYQMGKRSGAGGELLFNNTDIVAGLPAYGVSGDMIDDATMGALAAEGDYLGDDDVDEGELVEGDDELAVLGVDE